MDKGKHMIINITDKVQKDNTETFKLTDAQIDKAICEVWFELAKDPNIANEDYRLIFCKSWLAWTHKACYGTTELFRGEEKQSSKVEFFIWELCKTQTQHCCILCLKTSGIMKKLESEDNYIHIWWALLWDDFYINDYDKMTIARCESQEYSSSIKWVFCSSNKGFLLSCDSEGWKQKSHPFCLYMDKRDSTILYSSEKEDSSSWQISFSNWIKQDVIGYKELALDSDYSYKILTKGNNTWKWRGGVVSVYCDKHPPAEQLWYWRGSSEYDGFMVSWDFWGNANIIFFRWMVPWYLNWNIELSTSWN